MATGLALARKIVIKIALWQLVPGVVAAIVLAALLDIRTGYSALAGAAIAAISSVAMALSWPRQQASRGAKSLLGRFLLGETLKLLVTIVLFALVIAFIQVAPWAILCTYAFALAVYWVLLIRAAPKLTS